MIIKPIHSKSSKSYFGTSNRDMPDKQLPTGRSDNNVKIHKIGDQIHRAHEF